MEVVVVGEGGRGCGISYHNILTHPDFDQAIIIDC